MTNIRAMPLVQFPMTVGTNEDWTDSWAYLDASSNPISGAGIALGMMVRTIASDTVAYVVATDSAPTLDGVATNGSLTWGGTGGNVISLAIPRTVMARIPPGAYLFEVQGIADGLARTIASGAVTVVQGVVR